MLTDDLPDMDDIPEGGTQATSYDGGKLTTIMVISLVNAFISIRSTILFWWNLFGKTS